jgi:nitrogen fixation/metabolism regulation signal transduction histidine kinase
MKPGFGQKLFRLFLLFSLLPSAILTAAGYYLVIDAGSRRAEGEFDGVRLAEYYNEVLFSQLNAIAAAHNANPAAPMPVDFVLYETPLGLETPPGTASLTPAEAAAVVQSARQEAAGFVPMDGKIFQYVLRKSDDRNVIVGLVHGEQYSSLVSSMQTDIASRSVGRELESGYSVFLGVLFLILAVFLIILAFVFSRRIARSLSHPLQALADASVAVAEGDFRTRVAPEGETDIRLLIDSFNQMTEQLESSTARLAQAQRVAAWRQVARRFAHELKNPLQPILVSLYQIERQLMDTESYDRVYEPLKAASEEVRHLKALAERFAHLAKLPPPKFESTDIHELIATVTALYQQKDSKYSLDLKLGERPCTARVDSNYLREALHNLIQNGLDATNREGHLVVRLIVQDHVYEISVEDDGPGMDATTLESARLPYFSTKQKGHGLGLAIVDKSVNELGGQLSISSRPGQGTVVTITLPKEP